MSTFFSNGTGSFKDVNGSFKNGTGRSSNGTGSFSNGTWAEFQISGLTTISEIFVISTAFIAIVLNSLFIVCVWKVSTFSSGLRFFLLNFGAAAFISAFGSLSAQTINFINQIFSIGPMTELFCNSFRLFFAVPTNVMIYQLFTIAAERLIVLIKLKQHQKMDGFGFYYCRNSKMSLKFQKFYFQKKFKNKFCFEIFV